MRIQISSAKHLKNGNTLIFILNIITFKTTNNIQGYSDAKTRLFPYFLTGIHFLDGQPIIIAHRHIIIIAHGHTPFYNILLDLNMHVFRISPTRRWSQICCMKRENPCQSYDREDNINFQPKVFWFQFTIFFFIRIINK